MTTAINDKDQSLENMPREINEVLHWYPDGQSRVRESMGEFGAQFLGGMNEDGAVLMPNLSAYAPEVQVLTFLQHRTNTLSDSSWLGALLPSAVYRGNGPEEMNRARLESAVQAFDRTLQLDSNSTARASGHAPRWHRVAQ